MSRLPLLLVALLAAAGVVGCRAPIARAADNPTTIETIQVDGVTRTYRLHLPANSVADQPLPLVFDFHGYGGTGFDQEIISGMSPAADRLGYAVVYPDGIDKHWHYVSTEVDDVAFVNAIIDHLAQSANVDADRVYATGLSDGGFFSIYLGCLPQTRMAAIAPVAASLTGLQALGCAFAPRIPVLMTFGTADPIVPFTGLTSFYGERLLSVPESVAAFARHLDLSPTPTVDEWLPDRDPADGTTVHHTAYGNGELQLYAITGGGHTWPGGLQYLPVALVGKTNNDYNASETILTFFAAHEF
ncbi:MAG: esterase [Chloroflexi bacterium]|nr:esterase [Chloroflexota bacterium]